MECYIFAHVQNFPAVGNEDNVSVKNSSIHGEAQVHKIDLTNKSSS